MKHPTRRLQLNNQGTTLVELIVSLLVLTIIVVPLLNGFVVAQRANATSKNKMYAVTAAENIMEAVKAIGPDASKISASLRQTVSASNAEAGEYWIPNYIEGTDTYDIKLTMTPSGYSSSVNNYKFASMSAFSDEKSIMIFPGISGLDFDETALNSFYEDHTNWMNTKWQSDYASAYDTYLNLHKNWENNGRTGAEPSFTPPSQSNYAPLSLTELKSKMSRTTTIEINEIETTVIKENGTFQTKYEYELQSVVQYFIDNTYTATGSAVNIGLCADSYYPTIDKEYSGYCSESKHEGIKSIYLIYNPFGTEAADHQVTFARENVSVKSNAKKDMNVFIVVQTEGDKPKFNNSIQVDIPSKGTGALNLYCQANISCTSATSKTNSIVEDMTDTLNRIYTVTVEVFEHKDMHEASETAISSLTSTILKQPDK